MVANILNARRRKLSMTIDALARLSGVPIATVNRILKNPQKAQFGSVAAIGGVLGVDYTTAKKTSLKRVLIDRATEKARYVAKFVQGTQGLEAAGVDSDGYRRLVTVATETLLAGKRRKNTSSAKPVPSVTRTLVGWRLVGAGSMPTTSTSRVAISPGAVSRMLRRARRSK